MSVLFILIPISLFIALCFLGLFIWAVNTNQFEDIYGPSVKILEENNINDK